MDEIRTASPADLEALVSSWTIARYRWHTEEDAKASGIPFAVSHNPFTGETEWLETDAHLRERFRATLRR